MANIYVRSAIKWSIVKVIYRSSINMWTNVWFKVKNQIIHKLQLITTTINLKHLQCKARIPRNQNLKKAQLRIWQIISRKNDKFHSIVFVLYIHFIYAIIKKESSHQIQFRNIFTQTRWSSLKGVFETLNISTFNS